jgi:hypothetical protein
MLLAEFEKVPFNCSEAFQMRNADFACLREAAPAEAGIADYQNYLTSAFNCKNMSVSVRKA